MFAFRLLFLFALLVVGNEFYPISFLARRALAVYCLAGLFAVQILRLPTGWFRQLQSLGPLAVALVSLAIVAISETTSLVLASFVLGSVTLLRSAEDFKVQICSDNQVARELDASAVVWLLLRVAYELPLGHSVVSPSWFYRQFDLLPANLTSSTAIGQSGFVLYLLFSLFTVASTKRLLIRIFVLAVLIGSVVFFPFLFRRLPEELPIWLDAERQPHALVWGQDLEAGAIVRITNLEPAVYRFYVNHGDTTPTDSKSISDIISVEKAGDYEIPWHTNAVQGYRRGQTN